MDDGPFWRLWIFDMENETAKPVEGIDVQVGSLAQFATLENRVIVFLPYDDGNPTKIYEIDGEGNATERLDTAGGVYSWERIR